MLKVPFYRPSLTDAEIGEVVSTLRSGWLTTGPRTKQFEADFAAYVGQAHAIAVNSCTAALHLALEAIGIQAGDGVLVPTMTFAATAEVVRYLGATPVLADCRETDLNMDVADARRRLVDAQTRGIPVKAIMPVHYGGQIGDVDGVTDLAREFNLKVIEDAAHCCPAYYEKTTDHGPRTMDRRAEVRGQRSVVSGLPSGDWLPVGATADITCFSFYANKCITTGEGGMAVTNNAAWADRMRIMSLHGISRDAWKRYTGEGSWYYEIIAPGYKYNLTDIASAIGIHQLRRSDELHRQRAKRAGWYADRLRDIEEVILPRQLPGRIHSWHLYPIRLRVDRLRIDRAQFIAELQRQGIGTSVHWMPLHMHPYYRNTYGYAPHDFPVANRLYPELVTLPLYPDLTEAEVDTVCAAIRQLVG